MLNNELQSILYAIQQVFVTRSSALKIKRSANCLLMLFIYYLHTVATTVCLVWIRRRLQLKRSWAKSNPRWRRNACLLFGVYTVLDRPADGPELCPESAGESVDGPSMCSPLGPLGHNSGSSGRRSNFHGAWLGRGKNVTWYFEFKFNIGPSQRHVGLYISQYVWMYIAAAYLSIKRHHRQRSTDSPE